MSIEVPKRFGIKRHLATGSADASLLLAGMAAVVGVGATVTGYYGVALCAVAIGSVFGWLGMRLRRDLVVLPIINRAARSLAMGEYDDVEELHQILEKRRMSVRLRRALATQRVVIALRLGRLDSAVAQCDAALALPGDWLERAEELSQRVALRSFRALALALNGEIERAREDIREVRGDERVEVFSLARVEVAAAILMQREGRHAELRQHLARHRRMLAGFTTARERLIFKGLERMAARPTGSPYRAPAEKQTEAPDGWLAMTLPEVAKFVPTLVGEVAPLSTSPASPRSASSAPSRVARPSGGRRPVKALVYWAVLVGGFVAIFQVLPRPVSGGSALSDVSVWTWIAALILVLFLGNLVRVFRRQRGTSHRFTSIDLRWARGETDGTREELLGLTRSDHPAISARALAGLATLARREADLSVAREHLEDALARLTGDHAAMAADLLLPSLLAQRAVVMAAEGATEEAENEVRALAERFPSYPDIETTRRRVALMVAIRCSKFDAAAKVADTAIDVVFSDLEDLLVDLACLVTSPDTAAPGETERLRALMADLSEERAWVRKIAPELLDAFDRATAERD